VAGGAEVQAHDLGTHLRLRQLGSLRVGDGPWCVSRWLVGLRIPIPRRTSGGSTPRLGELGPEGMRWVPGHDKHALISRAHRAGARG
jgi:hypothetical protein